jgi:Ca2+-binding EF-hand superfamily protein
MPPPEEKGRLKRFKSDADALHAVFDKYRQSGDLDREHLAVALAHLKLSPQRLEEIFVRADSDRDGKISFEEFFTFVSRHEAELRTAFNTIDADKSGTIQRHEVEQLLANLNMHCTEEKLTAVFDMMDGALVRCTPRPRCASHRASGSRRFVSHVAVNHDGSVDFNEFHEVRLPHSCERQRDATCCCCLP